MEEKFSSIQHLKMLLSIGSSIEHFEKVDLIWKTDPKLWNMVIVKPTGLEFSLIVLHTQN
jgi:hypothetical protein